MIECVQLREKCVGTPKREDNLRCVFLNKYKKNKSNKKPKKLQHKGRRRWKKVQNVDYPIIV